MKKCPYCAEEIQDEAIKCRYCGEMLGELPGRAELEPAIEPEPRPAELAQEAQPVKPASAPPLPLSEKEKQAIFYIGSWYVLAVIWLGFFPPSIDLVHTSGLVILLKLTGLVAVFFVPWLFAPKELLNRMKNTNAQQTQKQPSPAEAALATAQASGDPEAIKKALAQKQGQDAVTGCCGCMLVCLLIGVLTPMCSSSSSSPSRSTSVPAVTSQPTTYSVTYKVTGSASGAGLTYQNESGGTDQMDVRIPWSKTFTARPGFFLYISAQNDDEYGAVKTEIVVNGVVVQTGEANSAYGIATASGRL